MVKVLPFKEKVEPTDRLFVVASVWLIIATYALASLAEKERPETRVGVLPPVKVKCVAPVEIPLTEGGIEIERPLGV